MLYGLKLSGFEIFSELAKQYSNPIEMTDKRNSFVKRWLIKHHSSKLVLNEKM